MDVPMSVWHSHPRSLVDISTGTFYGLVAALFLSSFVAFFSSLIACLLWHSRHRSTASFYSRAANNPPLASAVSPAPSASQLGPVSPHGLLLEEGEGGYDSGKPSPSSTKEGGKRNSGRIASTRQQHGSSVKKQQQQQEQEQREESVIDISPAPAASPPPLATTGDPPSMSSSSDHHASFDIQKVVRFPLNELVEATDNFSTANLLGQGSYGRVYKATLHSPQTPKAEMVVAVKRAKPDRRQDVSKFRKEIELLSRVSHKNLVRLLGYCKEDQEQLLVYEYVAGGNLTQNLDRKWRAKHSRPPLNWTERLLIAAGTARGLAYLHEEISTPFIHRDVKASNIMIDRHVVARLADFGTSKLMTPEELRKMSATIQGTAGYCDPDYLASGRPSKRIDVFSFGIVLLELITGDGPHKVTKPLRYYLKDRYERGGLDAIVDPSMGLFPPSEVHRIFDLGMRCTDMSDPAGRPPMGRVLLEIDSVLQPEVAIRIQNSPSRRLPDFQESAIGSGGVGGIKEQGPKGERKEEVKRKELPMLLEVQQAESPGGKGSSSSGSPGGVGGDKSSNSAIGSGVRGVPNTPVSVVGVGKAGGGGSSGAVMRDISEDRRGLVEDSFGSEEQGEGDRSGFDYSGFQTFGNLNPVDAPSPASASPLSDGRQHL